jgi:hypothetical protein
MKKRIYTVVFALCIIAMANAQAPSNIKTSADITGAVTSTGKAKADTSIKEGWTTGGTINISLTQATQNTYWVAVKGGGNTSFFGVKGIIAYSFNKKKGKINWLNSFNGRYAGASSIVYVPATNSTSTVPFAKSDDYLNFTSIYGKEFSKYWSYAGLFSLESQFERFMTPGYIKLGPGFLYQPSSLFNLFVSPVMANLTTKLTSGSLPFTEFGVDSGKTTVFALGAYVRASLTYPIAKGIVYTSSADIYSNYLKNPGNLVVDWTNLFTLTVNKYIGATLGFSLRYNDLEVQHLQMQQSIGVGFNYTLK